MGRRRQANAARIVVFIALIAAALVALLSFGDDRTNGLRIAAEAALLGVGAYVVSHLVWPRWGTSSRRDIDRERQHY